jgi:hypothetical protein
MQTWMLRLVPVVVMLVIAAGGAADARKPYRPPPPPPPPVDVGAELGAAIRARSATRVAKLLAESVQNYGIWFTDPACAKQFGTPGVVSGPELQAFARCLAQLKLQATTRQPGAADNAILTYDPGIELEVEHLSGRVRWLGFQYQTAADRGRPTLTAQAFEALRRSGKTNLDDAVSSKLDPLLERAKLRSVSAWMKLCIDEAGTLDQVTLRDSDAPSGLAGKVSLAFEVAMRSWRFLPFKSQGKPMAVCTMALLTYPAASAPLVETLPPALQPGFSIDKAGQEVKRGSSDDEDEDGVESGVEGGEIGGVVGGVVGGAPTATPPPPPPAPPQAVPPTLLEGMRVSGNKDILPADATKIEIARSGKDKIVGSFKLCVDAQGAVTNVVQLKSTGFSDYDAKIIREMKQWAYRPYSVNGKAVPVCTAVTFIYSQPQPPPPPAKKP